MKGGVPTDPTSREPRDHATGRVDPDTREALAHGVALFAGGSYFEAHEVWEDAWRLESGEVRLLLQALVQMAGGFVKAMRDASAAGTVKLLEASLENLALLPDELAGVSVKEVRAQLLPTAEAARRWRSGAAERLEAAPPRIRLRAT